MPTMTNKKKRFSQLRPSRLNRLSRHLKDLLQMLSLMKQLKKTATFQLRCPRASSITKPALPKLTAKKSVMRTSVNLRLVVEAAVVVVPRTSRVSIARRMSQLPKRRVPHRLTLPQICILSPMRADLRRLRMRSSQIPLRSRRFHSPPPSLSPRPKRSLPSSSSSSNRFSRCLICQTWPLWASLWACRCQVCLRCPTRCRDSQANQLSR